MNSPVVHPVLAEILIGAFQVPEPDLRAEASLDELGLDSLALVELADILAERLALALPEEELTPELTLGQLGELLAGKPGVA
ncbi:acyl carrier protein [Kitasatospora sp. NPDC006697]|uniref:acyl carrier protein n=1 Tax=Kitasatospora sp. NPDC006697 TaxID=3364020 RepID=UPI0036C30E7F